MEVPRQLHHGLGEDAAFLLVELLHLEVNESGHLDLVSRFAVGTNRAMEPLDPAAGVRLRAIPLEGARRGEEEDLGLHILRVDSWVADLLPDRCRLALVEVVDDQEVELPHRLPLEPGVGASDRGILSHQPEPPHQAAVHLVEDRDVIVAVLDLLLRRVGLQLRHIVIGEAVPWARVVAPPGFPHAGGEGRRVLPVVQRSRTVVRRLDLRRSDRPQVLVPALLVRLRHRQIAGEDVVEHRVVGCALYVGVAAQGVHAAARFADVPQQELHDAEHPDVLDAYRVLGLAHGVHDATGLVGRACRAELVVDPEQQILANAGDPTHGVGCVAREVAPQQLEDALRILERSVHAGDSRLRLNPRVVSRALRATAPRLIAPAASVVVAAAHLSAGDPRHFLTAAHLGVLTVQGHEVQTREDPVQVGGRLEVLVDDVGGVRVPLHVVIVIALVLDDVLDHPADERDVGARSDLREQVRVRRRAVEARVHHDQPRPSLAHRLLHEGERAGVVLGHVGTEDERAVGVADVDRVVGHGAAAEGLGERWHGGRVADSGVIVDVHRAPGAQQLEPGVALLVVVARPAYEGEALHAVHDLATPVGALERLVARLLDEPSHALDAPLPAPLLPVGGEGRPVKRPQDPGRRVAAELDRPSALRAERASVDRVLRVALDVDHPPLLGVDDRATSHGAERADDPRLLGVQDLEVLDSGGDLGACFPAAKGEPQAGGAPDLEEVTP